MRPLFVYINVMFTKVRIMDKPESKYILDESKGRRAYVLNLFGIFIILPALASYLAHLIINLIIWFWPSNKR
jgi:hypothetical protein